MSLPVTFDISGIPALRKAICDFHERYDDVTFRPEDILVGPGSKELIFLAMNVFKGGKGSLLLYVSVRVSSNFTTYSSLASTTRKNKM